MADFDASSVYVAVAVTDATGSAAMTWTKVSASKVLTFDSGKAISLAALSGLVSFDTGWTANSGAGTKTTAVPTYASGLITGAMVTALNTVSAALGTNLSTMDAQVKALTDKVAALETALAAGKLPNA